MFDSDTLSCRARLCRFSLGVKSLPRGFFRLISLLDVEFITLKARILVKHCLARTSDLRFIGHLFVLRFADVRWVLTLSERRAVLILAY
jgi:hypothetical protein